MKLKMLILVLLTVVVSSCQKEDDKTTAFSPKGYWRGHFYLYNIAVLNDDKGNSRLYMQVSFEDTANAAIKTDGRYTVTNSKYVAKYYTDTLLELMMEQTAGGLQTVSGIGYLSSGAAVPFELRKQP